MAHGPKKVVYAALAGNTLIAITKLAAAIYTGSSAMFSEAIHSAVDTGNQGLLLLGMRRAARPPDERHPHGYGMEIYFWAFVVAILIFAIGAGVSIYEGISRIQHPHELTNVWVNYVVLGLAMMFEASAWWAAYKEFGASGGRRGYFDAIRVSKDPTIFAVLLEDSAAMVGLLIALIALIVSQATGAYWLDGLASVLIGLVLAGTAVLLAVETQGLLIGENADPHVVDGIKGIATSQPEVVQVNEVLTIHFGPRDVLVNLSLDFDDSLDASRVETSIETVEAEIRKAYPDVRRVFVEAQSISGFQRERRLRRKPVDH